MDAPINFSSAGLDASVRQENEEYWSACETKYMLRSLPNQQSLAVHVSIADFIQRVVE